MFFLLIILSLPQLDYSFNNVSQMMLLSRPHSSSGFLLQFKKKKKKSLDMLFKVLCDSSLLIPPFFYFLPSPHILTVQPQWCSISPTFLVHVAFALKWPSVSLGFLKIVAWLSLSLCSYLRLNALEKSLLSPWTTTPVPTPAVLLLSCISS